MVRIFLENRHGNSFSTFCSTFIKYNLKPIALFSIYYWIFVWNDRHTAQNMVWSTLQRDDRQTKLMIFWNEMKIKKQFCFVKSRKLLWKWYNSFSFFPPTFPLVGSWKDAMPSDDEIFPFLENCFYKRYILDYRWTMKSHLCCIFYILHLENWSIDFSLIFILICVQSWHNLFPENKLNP